jgi:hypothetical protein
MKIEGVAARVAVVSAVSVILGFGLCTVGVLTQQANDQRGNLVAAGVVVALLLILGAIGLVAAMVLAIVASFRRPSDLRLQMPFPPNPPDDTRPSPPPPPRVVAAPPIPTQDPDETDHER